MQRDGRKKGSRQRVCDFLAEHDMSDRLVEFEHSTKTAQMAADAMGCQLGQIVKSLVFVVDGTPVLALVAGDRKGDASAIAREAGGSSARFADADTVRSATGYAIGGVSPFCLPGELRVLIDDSLDRFDTVYPAGGTPSTIVRMTVAEILDISKGRVASISLD